MTFDETAETGLFLAGPVALNYSPFPAEILVGTTTPNPPTNLNLSVTNESISTPSTITFTYAPPVPEPATFAMSMVGLTGLALLLRRRATAPHFVDPDAALVIIAKPTRRSLRRERSN